MMTDKLDKVSQVSESQAGFYTATGLMNHSVALMQFIF